jgi:hypothetical protein
MCVGVAGDACSTRNKYETSIQYLFFELSPGKLRNVLEFRRFSLFFLTARVVLRTFFTSSRRLRTLTRRRRPQGWLSGTPHRLAETFTTASHRPFLLLLFSSVRWRAERPRWPAAAGPTAAPTNERPSRRARASGDHILGASDPSPPPPPRPPPLRQRRARLQVARPREGLKLFLFRHLVIGDVTFTSSYGPDPTFPFANPLISPFLAFSKRFTKNYIILILIFYMVFCIL